MPDLFTQENAIEITEGEVMPQLICVAMKYIAVGVEKEFDRLPDNYRYPEYSHFIVIETLEEWNDPIELNALISQYTARSLDECVELVEEFEGYSQVVLVF